MRLFFAIAIFALIASPARAGVEGSISFQGRLTTDSGDPMPDGAYTLDFVVYDDEVAGEVQGIAPSVDVSITGGDGLVTTAIEVDSDWFAGTPRFLSIEVRPATEPAPGEVLLPRIQLHAVPFALRAMDLPSTAIINVQEANVAGTISAGGLSVLDGSVGIGTSTPLSPLHVVGGAVAMRVEGELRVNNGSGNGVQLLTGDSGNGIIRASGGLNDEGEPLLGSARMFNGPGGGEVVLTDVTGSSARVSAYIENGIGQLRLRDASNHISQLTGEGLVSLWDGNIVLNGAAGRIATPVLEITGGSDLAERFDAPSTDNVEPGMVMVIDPDHPGALRLATDPYDTKVVGIVSGANGINPGLILAQEDSIAAGAHPVALVGRVWCWCDADAAGPIEPGDLLTTSSTPGHAMEVVERSRASGAILGKAMTPLRSGKGLVLVLVSLQ